MRVLTIFMDMINTEFLNLYNNKVDETNFDAFFKELGGTTYTNVYTPCPDTARSLSSFWSGVPCYVNGCNKRGKYPKYFLETKTFLDTLIKNMVKLQVISDRPHIFPNCISQEHFIDTIRDVDKTSKDLFLFIDIQDSHLVLDDLGYTIKAVKKANIQLKKNLDFIFNALNTYDFDHIVFFSDHGHSLINETKRITPENFVKSSRTRIFLHHWYLNANTHKVEDKFQSITGLSEFYEGLYDSGSGLQYNNYLFIDELTEPLLIEDYYSLNSIIKTEPYLWNFKIGEQNHIFQSSSSKYDISKYKALVDSHKIDVHFPHLSKIMNEEIQYNRLNNYYASLVNDNTKKIHWYHFDGTYRYGFRLRKVAHFLIPSNFRHKLRNTAFIMKIYHLLNNKLN